MRGTQQEDRHDDAAAGEPAPPHERLQSAGARYLGPADDFMADVSATMLRTPLFSDLDAVQAGRLCAFMSLYEAEPGITLVTEGEPGDFMMLLMAGMVDVLRRNRFDYPARIAVAEGGQALGEMSMLDGEPRFASCVVLEPSRFAVLTRENLLQVMRVEPALGNAILFRGVQLLATRLRQTSSRLVGFLEAAREV